MKREPLNGNREVEYAVLDKTDPGDVALAVAIAADHIVEELRQLQALLSTGTAKIVPVRTPLWVCNSCGYEGFYASSGVPTCPNCSQPKDGRSVGTCKVCGRKGPLYDPCPNCVTEQEAKNVATAAKPEDRHHGAYKRYDVKRLGDPEGKHASCEHFVLDLDHDPYASKALEAYATACSSENPALAADIRKMRVVAVPKRRLMGGWGWKCAVCDKTVLSKNGSTFTDHVCTMRETAADLISKFQGSDCKHAHIVRNSDGKCRCFLCLEELHG